MLINLFIHRLLNNLPNSYAFTKALGEALAVEAMKEIPVMILRPSISNSYLKIDFMFLYEINNKYFLVKYITHIL